MNVNALLASTGTQTLRGIEGQCLFVSLHLCYVTIQCSIFY